MSNVFNIERVVEKEIENLEKLFSSENDQEVRRRIFIEIETLYKELDRIKTSC